MAHASTSKKGGAAIKNVPEPEEKYFPFFTALELKLFHQTVTNYKEHGKLLRDDAINLTRVFGSQIIGVFELLDEECVTALKGVISNRVIIQVNSKKGKDIYYIPAGDSLCQCIAYQRVNKHYCKHVLAAHFYISVISEDEYEDITETELNGIFKKISITRPVYSRYR